MNYALFIKRTETHQDLNFIKRMFEAKSIGKVKDITFFEKNVNGKTYNAAIVYFELWFNNDACRTLLTQMAEAKDGVAKFYFNQHQYWYINIHKQKNVEPSPPQQSQNDPIVAITATSDAEKVLQLEQLASSLMAQMVYLQRKHELMENILMEKEHRATYDALKNEELRFQLEDKNNEIEYLNDKIANKDDIIHSRV